MGLHCLHLHSHKCMMLAYMCSRRLIRSSDIVLFRRLQTKEISGTNMNVRMRINTRHEKQYSFFFAQSCQVSMFINLKLTNGCVSTNKNGTYRIDVPSINCLHSTCSRRMEMNYV